MSSLIKTIENSDRPLVMGILNVTPDSFSDGNRYMDKGKALAQAEKMVADGADIIDIGGESTRPGAALVTAAEEIDRVIPLLEIVQNLGVPVSVDSSKPEVMAAAAEYGASLLNDVRALQEAGALQQAAKSGLPVCLMHMQGQPRTMQQNPQYQNVVADVIDFLRQRIMACEAAGISRQKILLDPGFGFGKTQAHNLTLLKKLSQFKTLGCPLLIGVSRKSMLGAITGREVHDRIAASVAAAQWAAIEGAAVLRVHDVKETRDMVEVLTAIQSA